MKNPRLKQHLLAQPTRSKKVYACVCILVCAADTPVCISCSVSACAHVEKCVNVCVCTPVRVQPRVYPVYPAVLDKLIKYTHKINQLCALKMGPKPKTKRPRSHQGV